MVHAIPKDELEIRFMSAYLSVDTHHYLFTNTIKVICFIYKLKRHIVKKTIKERANIELIIVRNCRFP